MAILPVCTGVSSCARAKIVKKSRFEVFRDVIFPDFMHKAPTFFVYLYKHKDFNL